MKPYLTSPEETLKQLNASTEGLSTQEAAQRLEKHGPNKLAEGKKTTLMQRFLSQLADPMIIVLLVAAVLSAITSIYSGEGLTDVFIILAVVILNAVMGVVQESKAEEAIEALKTMTAATSKVMRDGKLHFLKSEELVPGDVIHLEAGDSVPADARIIECASLKIEEAALTGESVPVQKEADTLEGEEVPLGDRKNMVYMGSTVVYGRGSAVVTGTGMNTEMGKIADALTQAEDEATPLQRKLSALSRILTWLVLGICVLIFVVGIVREGKLTFDVAINTFMMAVSLAVAAIPEGLAAVVTIVLSIGVTKMSKRNAVIRRLTAVETLGCAQVICSDKTGTLTQNRMTVVDSYTADKALLARGMCLCSDAEPDENDEAVGEPTECALVNFATAEGLRKAEMVKETPRIAEAPFDSMRKMMSTLHRTGSKVTQYTKGAPDEILARCTKMLTAEGIKPMELSDKAEVMAHNKAMADKALRVLACAMKEYDALPGNVDPEAIENELVFIGLTGMIDPVRPEVKDAVDKCRDAGIRAVMITGDHIDTAIAIARDLGLLTEPDQAIMGSRLDDLTDDELDMAIEHYSVYARVQPEHKVRIVDAWKRKGKIVAMTGDGVNDAPSIKAADIGVGMGITGTDVTKNVADMILADDNFATIVSAVEEGRRIYANIRKAIQFLLSSNLCEVIAIFTATMLGFTILKPAHILWINLITDSLPALALGMEPGESDSMKRKPRSSKAGVFSGGVGGDIAYQGFFVALITLIAFAIGHAMANGGVLGFNNCDKGMTMAFLTMSMAEIFQSFNMRSRRGSSFTMKTTNWWLLGAGAAAFVLTLLVLYVPFLRNLFGFEPVAFGEFLIALVLAFAIIPLVELVKWIQRKTGHSEKDEEEKQNAKENLK